MSRTRQKFRPTRRAALLGLGLTVLAAAGLLPGCSQTKASSAAGAGPVVLPASVAEAWRGKVVVADFWATWCGPCRASSPNVQILHDTFAGDDGVLVVGVHADDGVDDPAAYMTEHQYTYPIVVRGEAVANAFGIHALPTFVILDAQGREVYRSMGTLSERTRKTMEKKVRELRG